MRVLVATWEDGVYVVAEANREQEMAGQSVRALALDGLGGALAIVGGRALARVSAPMQVAAFVKNAATIHHLQALAIDFICSA